MMSNCNYTLGNDRYLCANWDGNNIRTNQGSLLDTLMVYIPEDANVIEIQWKSLSSGKIVGIKNKQLLYAVSPSDIQEKRITLLAEIFLNNCNQTLIDTLNYIIHSQPIISDPGYKYVFSCSDSVLLNQWSYSNINYGMGEDESIQINWSNLNGKGLLLHSSENSTYVFNNGVEANLIILQKTISSNYCYAYEYLYLQHSVKPIISAGDDVWLKDSLARNTSTSIQFPAGYQGSLLSTLYRWSHNGSGQMLQSNRSGFTYKASKEDYTREFIVVTLSTQFCDATMKDSFRIYIQPNRILQPNLPKTFERGGNLTLSINPLSPIQVQSCTLYGDAHTFIQSVPLGQPTLFTLKDSLLVDGVLYIQYVIHNPSGQVLVLEDSIIANDYKAPGSTIQSQQISLHTATNVSKNILVYPNPSSTIISCSVPSQLYILKWCNRNDKGEIILESTLNPDNISIEHLPAGCFLFEIQDHEKVYRTKFIKL
ncbi:MAG: hypothetical protein U0U66_11235 [Cytophagaceae bacterium]